VGNHKIEQKIHRKLKKYDRGNGRLRVTLCKNNKRYYRFIPRLILETFISSCPENLECCHNDGNSYNNKLANLRWDTSLSNSADMIKHGNSTCGEKNPQNKLSEKEVIEIKYLLKTTDLCQWEIAKRFNVTRSAINSINNNYTWKHLKEKSMIG